MRNRLTGRAGHLVRAARGSANGIVTLGTRRVGTVARGGWIATAALEPLLEPLMEAARVGSATSSRRGGGTPVPAAPVPTARAEEDVSGMKVPGKRISIMVASLAAGVATGLAGGLVLRRRRHNSQWQQFEPATGPSTVDGAAATVVVPVEQPSQPS